MNSYTVTIDDREVGPDRPCYVVAEAGVNHNGRLKLALDLVDAAAEAGADAVKFQAFDPAALLANDVPKAGYQAETTGSIGDQRAMLEKLVLQSEEHRVIRDRCRARQVTWLCTPYDRGSVRLLEELEVPAYKVASTDTTNLPFLRYLAGKGRPLILSTGMCDLSDVERAVRAVESAGEDHGLVILHCLSEYPAPSDQLNLRAMVTLRTAFGHPTGFSDHSDGVGAAPWAVALGACLIEKHFTLDRSMDGPDHRASIEPHSLAELVREVRRTEAALGNGVKRVMPAERDNRTVMQKSLVLRRHISEGETISEEDLVCKRPGTGLPPEWWDRVAGRPAARDLSPDRPLQMADLDWRGERDT